MILLREIRGNSMPPPVKDDTGASVDRSAVQRFRLPITQSGEMSLANGGAFGRIRDDCPAAPNVVLQTDHRVSLGHFVADGVMRANDCRDDDDRWPCWLRSMQRLLIARTLSAFLASGKRSQLGSKPDMPHGISSQKADSFGSAPSLEISGRKNAKNLSNLKNPLLTISGVLNLCPESNGA
jgi:hypothetical protein